MTLQIKSGLLSLVWLHLDFTLSSKLVEQGKIELTMEQKNGISDLSIVLYCTCLFLMLAKKKNKEAASVTKFQRYKCATIMKVFRLLSLPFHQIVVGLDFGSTSSSRRTVISCL